MKDYPCVAHPEALGPVEVPQSHGYSVIPSTRTLTEIIREAVQHGVDFPTHGEDCVCMDRLIREVRLQVTAALPIRPSLDGYVSTEEWSRDFSARTRARIILERGGRHV
jgi:hypothetical protein